jgi:hypothetical protein
MVNVQPRMKQLKADMRRVSLLTDLVALLIGLLLIVSVLTLRLFS